LHEKSLSHINACLTVDRWGKNKTLSEELKSQISLFCLTCVKIFINSGVQKVHFSFITDTTQEIRKQDQMSQIIRFVVIDKNKHNKPIKLRIEESFLGFYLFNVHSTSKFVDQIVENIKDYGLDISKLHLILTLLALSNHTN
jgi:hypothetical protein